MNIETSERQGTLVFKLSGNLRAEKECFTFLDQVRNTFAEGKKSLVVDLGGIERVDSGGVGILASVVTSAENAGAALAFSSIPEKVEKLIVLVGLMRVLQVYPTLEDALVGLHG